MRKQIFPEAPCCRLLLTSYWPSLQVRCDLGEREVYPNHGAFPLSIFPQGTQSPLVKNILQNSHIPQSAVTCLHTGISAGSPASSKESYSLLPSVFLPPSFPSFLPPSHPPFLPQMLLESPVCIRKCPRYLGT